MLELSQRCGCPYPLEQGWGMFVLSFFFFPERKAGKAAKETRLNSSTVVSKLCDLGQVDGNPYQA